jgi:hypothetical protein
MGGKIIRDEKTKKVEDGGERLLTRWSRRLENRPPFTPKGLDNTAQGRASPPWGANAQFPNPERIAQVTLKHCDCTTLSG